MSVTQAFWSVESHRWASEVSVNKKNVSLGVPIVREVLLMVWKFLVPFGYSSNIIGVSSVPELGIEGED